MDLIGKTTIHPVLFYTGKIAGYCCWILLILSWLNINIILRNTFVLSDYFAIALFLAGLVLVVISLINLGSSTRLGLPTDKTVFKTNGLYKISRNPMYIGFNLWTLSSMIYIFSILVIISGIYSIIVYHFIILSEEKFLENRFGVDYSDFKKKVSRYL
jgi:protein-S-isoprenylcysteine O-methyltransferase Ste14